MTYLGDWGTAIIVEEYYTDSMGGTQENQYVKSEEKNTRIFLIKFWKTTRQFKKFQPNALHLSVISLIPELEMTYLGDWGSAFKLEEYWTDSMRGTQENNC